MSVFLIVFMNVFMYVLRCHVMCSCSVFTCRNTNYPFWWPYTADKASVVYRFELELSS